MGGGQHFSKTCEIQNILNYLMGVGGKGGQA